MTFHANDNLHEMPKPILGENKKNISKCRLLIVFFFFFFFFFFYLFSMLSANRKQNNPKYGKCLNSAGKALTEGKNI